MKARLGAALVALLTAIGITLVVATPAHAAFECPSSSLCIYDFSDGTGERYYWSKSLLLADSDHFIQIGWPWNDRAGSARNNLGTHAVKFYEHSGPCSGAYYFLYPAQITYGFGGYLGEKVSCFYFFPS